MVEDLIPCGFIAIVRRGDGDIAALQGSVGHANVWLARTKSVNPNSIMIYYDAMVTQI